MSEIGPFDYLNSINDTKHDIMNDEIDEKKYVPFVINRALSNFVDTCMYANEMNRLYNLTHRMQYVYLKQVIRKGRRFSKWSKPKRDKTLDIIIEYYDCSIEKALEYSTLLNSDEIKQMKKDLYKGGTK